ncbi:hypothetical protein H8S20_16910 [Clostridium sp. NSJ-6]|uniref:Uncharacterized protein n=1 Tax=Clostridium hominis TaxID=2763036 RepID=A0ABR7DGK4_9CLOT|nr:hypothetical protein [Clostridium hominis]MBC5630539.1 hypothetical protein [Clostridium hominis]
MKNESISVILSEKDINKIKKAYNNEYISDDYLNFEIVNIMKCEDISKEKAINKILSLVNA